MTGDGLDTLGYINTQKDTAATAAQAVKKLALEMYNGKAGLKNQLLFSIQLFAWLRSVVSPATGAGAGEGVDAEGAGAGAGACAAGDCMGVGAGATAGAGMGASSGGQIFSHSSMSRKLLAFPAQHP